MGQNNWIDKPRSGVLEERVLKSRTTPLFDSIILTHSLMATISKISYIETAFISIMKLISKKMGSF